MPDSRLIVELRVRDLSRAQAFYSAVGMEWARVPGGEIGSSGLPVRVEANPYLGEFPLLWGTIGTTDFVFYLDQGIEPVGRKASGGTVFRIQFDEPKRVASCLALLESQGLLIYLQRAKAGAEPVVLDPDGRALALCSPSPFMHVD